MPCPFPGMDPYIERPEIWPDFHDRFVTFLCGALQPALRPRYIALTQDRLYVVEAERPIRPDVSVGEKGVRYLLPERPEGCFAQKVPDSFFVREPSGTATALLEAVDAPAVFELWREEIREPLIHIIEPAAGNRLVTAIEVLSPENKIGGAGRRAYLKKRDEFWEAGANLVEIDLLRAGRSTVRLSPEKLETLKPYRYLVGVTRRWPTRQEVYAFPLEHRLPRIAIPLSDDDHDVPLDLQAAFARCWDEGPYPELLHYDAAPPADLNETEITWCQEVLRKADVIKA